MGVRGLQTYLEQYCPSACYKVHLQSLISEYRSETGQVPEIVIDAQSCYRTWTQGIDWTIGFEIQEYIYRLQSFVEAFLKLGVKLVFYFGGVTPSKKRREWIERRIRNINDTFKAYDWYYSGKTLRDLPKELNSIPPNMGIISSFILKYILNCEVYMSVDECDEEIIHYVHEHQSFAIFAQDTDFIVSQINCRVLSSNKFNIDNMTTVAYDRKKLIECLQIRSDQLPLLSLLAGNDLLPFDELRAFHVRLCKLPSARYVPFQVLMPAIGKYINQLPNIPIDELLQYICHKIYEDDSRLDDMKLSYNSYLIHDTPKPPPVVDNWSQILKIARYRMKNVIFPLCVWSVISERVFEISVSFEDLRKTHDKCEKPNNKPSATITRPLRQRLYGILLKEKNDPSLTVEEWCGENDQSYREPVIVKPIYPTVVHPGLVALWSDDMGERLNRIKWNLFLDAISPKIKEHEKWLSLDEDYVVAVAVCYYLYDQNFILKWELHAMLATIALHPMYDRRHLNSLPHNKPDMRAIQISVAFIRTYGIVVSLLAACGFPVPMSENIAHIKFEGKLFQVKYKEAKQKCRFKQLCGNGELTLKFFFRMKNVVYREHPKPKKSNDREDSSSALSLESNTNTSVASRLTLPRHEVLNW